jgi:hypothetical protein
MLAADLFAFSSFASQLAAESELWAVNMSQTEDPVVPLADRQRQRRPSVLLRRRARSPASSRLTIWSDTVSFGSANGRSKTPRSITGSSSAHINMKSRRVSEACDSRRANARRNVNKFAPWPTAPVFGTRGRRFKSCHSDQLSRSLIGRWGTIWGGRNPAFRSQDNVRCLITGKWLAQPYVGQRVW